MAEKQGTGQGKGANVVEPEVPTYYANVVVSSFTPFDLDLIFAKAGLPATLPAGQEAAWTEHMKYVARVSVPFLVVPSLIKLLETQLERAKAAGIEIRIPESTEVEK